LYLELNRMQPAHQEFRKALEHGLGGERAVRARRQLATSGDAGR
jgi:hypothetical protein